MINGLYKNVTLMDVQLAAIYCPLLISLAKVKQVITYGDLVKKAKLENPDNRIAQKAISTNIGRRLDALRLFTSIRRLPDLTSIVVDVNGECGHFYQQYFDPEVERNKVFSFSWSDISLKEINQLFVSIIELIDDGCDVKDAIESKKIVKYWIVTLKETYSIATSKGFLWSPNLTKSNKKNVGYENMELAQEGDIIFSCVNQHIKDIGIVAQSAYPQLAPEYPAFKSWVNMEGRTLKVDWFHPKKDIFLKNYIDSINKINSLPSPFIKRDSKLNTIGLKQQYLIEIANDYANLFLEQLSITNKVNIRSELDKFLMQRITAEGASVDMDVTTTRSKLVEIRTAQLKFIANLLKVEKVCRVTGTPYDFDKVRDRYLIASHIKRWAKCNNIERVDGNNGLFLAPHIDYLFDRYLISFKKDGSILISDIVKKDAIFEKWNITEKNVGSFSDKQDFYLEGHRKKFFEKQRES